MNINAIGITKCLSTCVRITASALLAMAFGCIPFQAMAQELPDNLAFKKLRGSRKLVLKNCELVSKIKQFEITNRGKKITPAEKFQRKSFTLPQRYKFFACAADQSGSASLYVKESEDGAVSQFSFKKSDFPPLPQKRGLSKVCPNGTRGISFGILYKPAADASDARSGKPVVLFQGGNKTGASAIRIYSSNGDEVCRFAFKASSIPGINGGSDHYFAGWSGGCGKTGSQIGAAAGGSIYIEWKGGQCLGPVNPTSRVGGIA